jgi:hypothetical protein
MMEASKMLVMCGIFQSLLSSDSKGKQLGINTPYHSVASNILANYDLSY